MRTICISSGLCCAYFVLASVSAGVGAATRSAELRAPSVSTAPGGSESSDPTAQAATPREVVQRAVEPVLATLSDRSMSRQQRAESISAIVRKHMDYRVLSRAMLGARWETLAAGAQDAFIDAFAEHLTGVYLPLMDNYSGQLVQVTEDAPVGRADHMVMLAIRDNHGDVQRQIATLACRLRQVEGQWRVVDLTIEGISIARIFGAQFRPVLAQEGIDALVQRLRQRNAENDAAVRRS